MNAHHLVPPPRAVLVYRRTGGTVPRATTFPIPFDRVEYDHIGAWSGRGADDSLRQKVFVPTGARFVRIMANAIIGTTGNSNPFLRYIYKNGSELFRTSAQLLLSTEGAETGPIASAVVAVKPGDYFSLVVWHNRGSGSGEVLDDWRSWLFMEVVG